MISNEVVSKGRKCRECGDVGSDLQQTCCMGCGHDYTKNDPVCGFDKDGMIVEIDGRAVTPTNALPALSGAPTAPAAPAPAAPATVPATDDKTGDKTDGTTGATTVEPAPVVTGDNTATVTTAAPAPAEPAPVTTVHASKKAYIEVVVDESARETRPPANDPTYAAAPKTVPAVYDLKEQVYAFGRENQLDMANFLKIEDDNAVSRLHGYFRRLPDGSYQVQNQSKGCPVFVRGKNIEVGVGEDFKLSDGDELEIGDWYTITYHDQPL